MQLAQTALNLTKTYGLAVAAPAAAVIGYTQDMSNLFISGLLLTMIAGTRIVINSSKISRQDGFKQLAAMVASAAVTAYAPSLL